MPSLLVFRQPAPETTLIGVLDLASSADLFLQGVLCAQFAHYTNVNENDSWLMKLVVAGLALLTTLKTVQIIALRWLENVTLLENLEAVTNLWHIQWISRPTLILGATIVFHVQMFFCHRLWIISHNIYIVSAAITMFGFAIAAAGVSTYLYANTSLSAIWASTYLGFAMCGDLPSDWEYRVLPTGALCALVTFVSIMTIVTGQFHAKTASGLTAPWVSSAVASTLLPKFYAVAAMWTLNTREDIRFAATNKPPTNLDVGTAALGGTSGSLHGGEAQMNGSERTKSLIEVKIIDQTPV
ncbi:hypothetical protein MVEN_00662000 [Mycena venus]|uniref:Uncharacterized protein n=1 Tax=Mycena venus TaxID=2733690 RepID=A0A8H6YRN0_9AGAR|nr:hypothetical protein MVEN_00662000 [Mycena venus]